MIDVVVDDLAFVAADAVVRPTTTALEPLTPTLRRLEDVGGPSFYNQLRLRGELAVGAAVVTSAGELTADFVVHAVIMSPDEPISAQGVRRALISVLQRAGDWQLKRLAIPPLGVGPGNLELEDSAQLMVRTLLESTAGAGFPRHVSIVVDNEEARSVFVRHLERTVV
ncbi:MAG: macro domain-containing protein [Gemmatimonadales bacterium]